MFFDKILRDKVRYLFWYIDKLRRLEAELLLQGANLSLKRYNFIHLSRAITTQLIYLIINEEISNGIKREPLHDLYNQLWVGEDKEEINDVFRGNSYFDNYVRDIFVNLFNENLQAFFYDYQVSMWSAFEQNISFIYDEFSGDYIDELNASHFKKFKNLVNSNILNKLDLDKHQQDNAAKIFSCSQEVFLKKFPKYVTSDDKINYIFKFLIKENYTRDDKEDKEILHFIRSLRNTIHNNGVHLGSDIKVKIQDDYYELNQGEIGSFRSDINVIKFYFELLNIYSHMLFALP